MTKNDAIILAAFYILSIVATAFITDAEGILAVCHAHKGVEVTGQFGEKCYSSTEGDLK